MLTDYWTLIGCIVCCVRVWLTSRHAKLCHNLQTVAEKISKIFRRLIFMPHPVSSNLRAGRRRWTHEGPTACRNVTEGPQTTLNQRHVVYPISPARSCWARHERLPCAADEWVADWLSIRHVRNASDSPGRRAARHACGVWHDASINVKHANCPVYRKGTEIIGMLPQWFLSFCCCCRILIVAYYLLRTKGTCLLSSSIRNFSDGKNYSVSGLSIPEDFLISLCFVRLFISLFVQQCLVLVLKLTAMNQWSQTKLSFLNTELCMSPNSEIH